MRPSGSVHESDISGYFDLEDPTTAMLPCNAVTRTLGIDLVQCGTCSERRSIAPGQPICRDRRARSRCSLVCAGGRPCGRENTVGDEMVTVAILRHRNAVAGRSVDHDNAVVPCARACGFDCRTGGQPASRLRRAGLGTEPSDRARSRRRWVLSAARRRPHSAVRRGCEHGDCDVVAVCHHPW